MPTKNNQPIVPAREQSIQGDLATQKAIQQELYLDKLRRAKQTSLKALKFCILSIFCLWLALMYMQAQTSRKIQKYSQAIQQVKKPSKVPVFSNEKGDLEWIERP